MPLMSMLRRMAARLLRSGAPSRQQLGQKGERVAARHLKAQGYRILTRNFRCKAGEIDIIATCGETLCFVEVRSVKADHAVCALDSIGAGKRRRLERAARYYLARRVHEGPVRFDVVKVVDEADRPRIELIRDAFGSGGLL